LFNVNHNVSYRLRAVGSFRLLCIDNNTEFSYTVNGYFHLVNNYFNGAIIFTLEQNMRELNEIRSDLKDRNLQAVARQIRMHPNVLYSFMSGGNQPRYETILKIESYLTGGNDRE